MSTTPPTPKSAGSASPSPRGAPKGFPSNPSTPARTPTQDEDEEVFTKSERPERGEDGRRTKALLAQYYGVGKHSEKKKALDELNIDNGYFNAQKFVKKLLKEKHLKHLMKKENQLASEIKAFDKDLQTLVYENYNKFIIATDTVKQMKNHVISMEDEMKNLAQNVEEITKCSDIINTNLSQKREKIDKLSGVNRTLKKMQFLLELPSRLNKCLELKAYAVAVKYYSQASIILKQYSHLPSFKSIQQETNDVMNKLKNTLKDIVYRPTTSSREVEDYVRLLIRLNEPMESLQVEFLNHKKERLQFILSQFKSDKSQPILKNLENLHKVFLPTFRDLAQLFISVFTSPEQDMQYFEKWTKEIFTAYFQHARTVLVETYKPLKEEAKAAPSQDKEFELETLAADLKGALELFSNDLFLIHSKVPGAMLSDKVANIVADSVKNFLLTNINMMKDDLQREFSTIAKQKYTKGKQQNLHDLCNKISSKLLSDLDSMLKQFKHFIESKDKFLLSRVRYYKSWIKDYVFDLFGFVVETLTNYCIVQAKFEIYKSEKKIDTTPSGALIFCKLSLSLQKQIVKVEHMLEDRFPIQQTTPATKGQAQQQQSKFDVERMNLLLDNCAKNLIMYYIEAQGQALSKLIRTGIESPDWLNMEMPRSVRHMTTVVAEDVEVINNEINDLFPDAETRSESISESETSSYSLYKKNSLDILDMGNMHLKSMVKIFNKSLGTFTIKPPQEFSRSAIITEVIKLALKTFEECVRASTFSKNGFQQLQVDLHYLRTIWTGLTTDDNLINSMLTEVITSTSERCLEPSPLELNVVETICNKALQEKKK